MMMKAKQKYEQICTYYKENPASSLGYSREQYEQHHIIPTCMGGSDAKENLVELPFHVHQYVHNLLCEVYPNNKSLKRAKHQINNRSCVGGTNNPNWSKSFSLQHRERLKQSHVGRVYPKRKKERTYILSEEHRKSIGATVSQKYTKQRREEHSTRMTGRGNANFREISEEEKSLIQQYDNWVDLSPNCIYARLKKQGVRISPNRIKRLQIEYIGN